MTASRWTLTGIVAAAFVLRLIAGLAKGPEFVDHGYSFYADLSQNFWTGDGLCYAPGEGCAVRMPLYPVLIAPFLALGAVYPWLVVVQALVGALQPLIAYALGRHLFDARAARVAAIGAALNPYAVVHGPSFQETVFFNALIAVAVLLLICSVNRDDPRFGLGGGFALALATLISVRLVLFVPLAVAWAVVARRGPLRIRLRHAALVAIPLAALLGGWMIRNALVVGAPVLTTEAGLSLWVANHPETMAHLPDRSIDLVTRIAWQKLTDHERAAIEELSDSPVAQDRYFKELALDYVRDHPAEFIRSAAAKAATSVGGWLSPAREWPVQLAYLALFAPLNALAVVGWWRARRDLPAHALVGLLAASLMLTTTIFWAHTSHRSVLHVFKMVYAASLVAPLTRRQPAASVAIPA